jgi:hypothetical protein
MVVDVAPKKISLSENEPLRVAFSLGIETFPAGVYRVDVYWNDQPSWRIFFRVAE